MERCPNCGARCDGSQPCRRCGLEPAPLLAVEEAAERLIARALASLAEGDSGAALADLAQARRLRREPFLDLLLGLARSETAGERLAAAAQGATAPPLRLGTADSGVALHPRILVDLPDWPLVPTAK